jgi:thioredoxin reductase
VIENKDQFMQSSETGAPTDPTIRPEGECNEVKLVVRSDLKSDLKFDNKLQLYHCADEGHIEPLFNTGIKEISNGKVVLMDTRTGKVINAVDNDFVFALIGGERPTKFLEMVGVSIG